MVRTRSGKDEYAEVPESSNHRRGAFRPLEPQPTPPTPPTSLKQLFAPLNAIMQRLTTIDERQAGQSQQHQQLQESSYFDFLATQPPEFAEMMYPFEVNHWLRMTKSKFRLLRCSEFQKTLFAAQQLRGSASAWWATYTATIQDNHQVSWNEFSTAFHECHISVGIMRRRLWEFLDL
jgi:hypothetical protein